MEQKTFQEVLKVEKAERAAKPFYIRIPLNIGEHIWYRIILMIPDILREFKWDWQELRRGYSDCDVWNVDWFIVRKVRGPLKAFIRHQEEEGNSLPMEFSTNPSGWLEALKKIEFSFDEAWEEETDFVNHGKKMLNLNEGEKDEYYKKKAEGFALFGKYLQNLWD